MMLINIWVIFRNEPWLSVAECECWLPCILLRVPATFFHAIFTAVLSVI